MPRVSIWNGEYNDNRDYCRDCMPTEDEAYDMFEDEIPQGYSDNEAIEVEAEHPLYEGEGYRCDKCNRELTGDDD